MNVDDKIEVEKRVAADIISIAERIFFSKEFFDYRFKWGSKGAQELFIQTVMDRYFPAENNQKRY